MTLVEQKSACWLQGRGGGRSVGEAGLEVIKLQKRDVKKPSE